MIGTNGTGPLARGVTVARDFEIFDRLPPEVREALNTAKFKYVAAEIAILVNKWGGAKVAALLPASDQRLLDKEAGLVPTPKPRRPFDDWQP